MKLENVRVVIACRTFDLEHDPQFVAWAKANQLSKVEVSDLAEVDTRRLIGNDYESLNARQRTLLKSVQNLAMWLQLRAISKTPSKFVSATDLMKAFWQSRYDELIKRGVPLEEVHAVLDVLIDYFNNRGVLSAPSRLIERHRRAASHLQSLNILRVSNNTVAFCHQSYSDYLTALQLLDGTAHNANAVFDWLGDKSRQSLFRREQLRLLLSLLRDENVPLYLSTVRLLLDSPNIRFHLKHLCLHVLKHVDVPTDQEIRLVLELLDLPRWKEHILWQVLWRSPNWLSTNELTAILRAWLASEDDALIDQSLSLLRSVDVSCGDIVAMLLAPYLSRQDDKWRARADWMFVRSLHDDSDELFTLRLRLVEVNQTFDYVDWAQLAKSKPHRCLPLVIARLKGVLHQLAQSEPYTLPQGQRPSSLFSLSTSEEMDALRHLAAASSEYIWTELLPRFERLLATSRERVRPLLSGLAYVPRHRRHLGLRCFGPLLNMTVAAGEVVGKTSANPFLLAMERLSAVRTKRAQRVVLELLRTGPTDMADWAIEWLITEKGRLQLGSKRSSAQFLPARRLIKRFAPLCSQRVYRALERTLLNYHPREEWQSFRRRHEDIKHGWCRNYEPNLYGLAHFFLLSALPRDRLSATVKGARGVAIEKFGRLWPSRFLQRSGIGGTVTSPVPHDKLHLLKEATWLRIMARFSVGRQGGEKWVRRDDDTISESSPETFARDLGLVTQWQPSRFAALAVRIPVGTSPKYLGAILRALQTTSPPEDTPGPYLGNWHPASGAEIEAAFRYAQRLGLSGLEHLFCTIVGSRPDAGWSDWVVDEICRLAMWHPDPGREELLEVKEWGDRTIADLERGAINHVRGPAAHAIRSLLIHDAKYLERLKPAIGALLSDEHPGVRTAAIEICLAAWLQDRDQATDWFIKACESDDDRLLATYNAVRFVNIAQTQFLDRLIPLITRMVQSNLDEVRERGAARVTFIWLKVEMLKELLQECRCAFPSHRIGIASVAAAHAADDDCGNRSRQLLAELLNDPEKTVRENALAVFHNVHVLESSEMEPFVAGYLTTKTFKDDPTELLDSLEDLRRPLIPYRDALFAICQSVSGDLAPLSRSIATHMNFMVGKVPALLLRLYEQAQGKDLLNVQDRCLDVWDQLLENRVGDFRGLIDAIDV